MRMDEVLKIRLSTLEKFKMTLNSGSLAKEQGFNRKRDMLKRSNS